MEYTMTTPTNYTPSWKSYMATGNTTDIVASTTVATAIGTKVDAINGQSVGISIQSGSIDNTTKIAPTYASGITRSLSSKLGDIADIRDWGVSVDNTGTSSSTIDTNTENFLKAISESSTQARLYIPKGVTFYINPMIIPTSGFNLVVDGTIILAPNSAADNSVMANMMDFRGSNWNISGSGVFDGNKSNQSWSVGQVVGGLTSNSYKTSDTWLLDPGSDAVSISNFLIEGVTVQNVGNWPVSFGYASNATLRNVKMLSSGNSPQWFAGATDCAALQCYSESITDAGFSLYAGTTRCSIIGGTAVKCNQGFGSYCEDDTRTPNTDPLVANCTTISCVDGSIGFTTGGTITTLTQIRPTAIGNRSINDGTSGTSGISCWGAVGAQDVTYIGNRQSGFGASATSGNVNLAYFDSATTGLVFQDNFATSAGSSSAKANGVTFNGTKGVYVDGFSCRDSSGTLNYGIGGTVGAESTIGQNTQIGTMENGNFMELNFSDDTVVMGQRTNDGPAQYSVGIEVTSGQLSQTAGTFAAAGTTQTTATLLNTQFAQVTSGTGGVILPAVGTGASYVVNNSTSETISVYPNSGATINGNSENVALTVAAGSTVTVVQIAANSWVKTSQT